MAITAVEAYTGPAGEFPSHSRFDALVAAGGAARVLATDEDGVHYAWQLTEAMATALGFTGAQRVAFGGLKTPSAAKLAAMAAEQAASDAFKAKDDLARTTIINQVNAIKASGAPNTWSNADRRFMALVWTLHRLD